MKQQILRDNNIFEEFGDGTYGRIWRAVCGEEVICRGIDTEARELPWAMEHWDWVVESFIKKHGECVDEEEE